MSRAQHLSPNSSDGMNAKEVAPFLKSLRRMLDIESPRILRWTPDGNAFEIHDMAAMTSDILPKYFKHCKYASFQRQLNYFHFRKWTKSRAVVCTFSNKFFQRDQPALTWRITRKRALLSANDKLPEERLSLSAPDVQLSRHVEPLMAVEVATPVKSHPSDDEAPLAWIDKLYPELDFDLLAVGASCCFSASTLLSL
ncbi:hsf-type dna-binding [Plasmopara halstedii]|uniref:Hsf-type dna-binding n=1 Tax=Plasmopara halstedii TaxID=4781 RepID=A0A0P1A6K9_PLAHL|nr:hsf-type dna-binding [Plasmopara halstedii]CEG36025.1 hsf-type dna-binding [Plasmopara halstedii]|eukprot:XP_024572394.1 hsf-type dna-binding [Plasmopara halstedii]